MRNCFSALPRLRSTDWKSSLNPGSYLTGSNECHYRQWCSRKWQVIICFSLTKLKTTPLRFKFWREKVYFSTWIACVTAGLSLEQNRRRNVCVTAWYRTFSEMAANLIFFCCKGHPLFFVYCRMRFGRSEIKKKKNAKIKLEKESGDRRPGTSA